MYRLKHPFHDGTTHVVAQWIHATSWDSCTNVFRPATKEDRRTVIVESGLFGSLLYLNNNLHAVHHAFPGLPWHAIPAARRAHRHRFDGPEGPRVHPGYAAIARRWLLRPRGYPIHPGLSAAG